MALLAHSADYHSEGYLPGYHVPIVGAMHVHHRSSVWLEKRGKAKLSGRAAVQLDG